MNVGTRQGRIVQVRPKLDAPVNKGHLCVKGRYGFEFVYAQDRVTQPMIREHGAWQQVSWESAISFAATRLKEISAQFGSDSIGVLGSARATNEENYLAQKFARVVLKTNNVDCCARVCHAPTASAMKLMLGTGAATNSFDDIERAATILVCGSNTTENHPVIGARIRQAALRGARLIVIDPRRIELTEHASIHLQLRPGTNVPLLNALACAIVDERLFDEAFIRTRVDEWDQFVEFIHQYQPERVAPMCGVDAGLIRVAARLYAANGPSLTVHGLGVTEHTQGTEGVMCLVNLALLTGNLGKPGAGLNPLRGQNNVQGSAHMGCEPNNLTGYVAIEPNRALFESVWGKALPTAQGRNLLQMMDAAETGDFKALWAIGYDIYATNPNAASTRRALSALDLLIVQDMFLNETAREFAHVFLPCASSFEKEGTFMNAERRVQRVRKAIEPVGVAKSDWEIICEMARAMGHGEGFEFLQAEDIWNEIRQVWKTGRGISYAGLEPSGIQWPCPADGHPGTTILHTEAFTSGLRAGLRRVDFEPTAETTTAEFPFLLMTGRTLHQFNAGTMTMRTKNAELRPIDVLDVARLDAQRLGLTEGMTVRLRSRYGTAVLPVHIDESVQVGHVFATFHTAEVFLNQITSAFRDKYTETPEYKVTAVRIEAA
jgi:formate dehydrogenase major subunit